MGGSRWWHRIVLIGYLEGSRLVSSGCVSGRVRPITTPENESRSSRSNYTSYHWLLKLIKIEQRGLLSGRSWRMCTRMELFFGDNGVRLCGPERGTWTYDISIQWHRKGNQIIQSTDYSTRMGTGARRIGILKGLLHATSESFFSPRVQVMRCWGMWAHECPQIWIPRSPFLFFSDEVLTALSQMVPLKSSGPAGFSIIFFHKYWHLIG